MYKTLNLTLLSPIGMMYETLKLLTLLSPPETANIFPVIDQLRCQTTSLNLFNTFDVQLLLVPSFVQIITLQS